ncbi:MAG: hypothetical protein ACFFE8_07725 [Candidatus Heimdallarchaeota archaeon]
MEAKVSDLIDIEWRSQLLIQEFSHIGPSIEPLKELMPKTSSERQKKDEKLDLLVMQGSFDPPTRAHIEIIKLAIQERLNSVPKDQLSFLILLSLQHVEKRLNVLERALLGFRVEMLSNVLKNTILSMYTIPTTIFISNVGRYIDLTPAITAFFPARNSISYIVGIDVFKKILMQKFYRNHINHVLSEVFQNYFLVAGRNEITSREELDAHVRNVTGTGNHLTTRILDHIHFLKISPEFQNVNATEIRKTILNGRKPSSRHLYPSTYNELRKWGLYGPNPKLFALQIGIQQTVSLALENGLVLEDARSRIEMIVDHILKDENSQERVIKDYRQELDTTLRKRWSSLPK